MKTNNKLYIFALLLIVTLSMPFAFAKAEDGEKDNGKDAKIGTTKVQEQDNDEDSQDQINKDSENKKDEKDLNKKEKDGEDKIKDEIKSEDNDGDVEEDDQFDGEEHKSTVSTFVQNLLDVAQKEHGEVSDKIKEIAQEQDTNKDEVANKIDTIKNRSKIKTFFFGTDFKNVGDLRSEMVKTSNQIDQLNGLIEKTTSTETKTILQEQVKNLETQQQKVGDLLVANESKFSLFGWFVKIFSK